MITITFRLLNCGLSGVPVHLVLRGGPIDPLVEIMRPNEGSVCCPVGNFLRDLVFTSSIASPALYLRHHQNIVNSLNY